MNVLSPALSSSLPHSLSPSHMCVIHCIVPCSPVYLAPMCHTGGGAISSGKNLLTWLKMMSLAEAHLKRVGGEVV